MLEIRIQEVQSYGAGMDEFFSRCLSLDKLSCDKLFFEFHMMDRGLMYQPVGKVTIRYPHAN